MVLTRSRRQLTEIGETSQTCQKQISKSAQDKNDHTDMIDTANATRVGLLMPKPDSVTKRATELMSNQGVILPDSTTQQVKLGDEHNCTEGTVTMTAKTPTCNENIKSTKRNRKRSMRRRKRKMTGGNSDDKSENLSGSREMTGMRDASVSSLLAPLACLEKRKPKKIEDKERKEQIDEADVGTEMQEQQTMASITDVTHDIPEIKKPTVNPKEVFQLYKKESYNAKGDLARIKGKPKSGRFWKTEQMNRFSGIKQDRPLKTSWQKKMMQKAEMKNMKAFEAELKEAKKEELERKKKYRAEKIKRKQENQRKSEIVQVISNPAKIKRMKKKQLRTIVMRSLPDSSKKQVFPS